MVEWCSHRGCCGEGEQMAIADEVVFDIDGEIYKQFENVPVIDAGKFLYVIYKGRIHIFPIERLVYIIMSENASKLMMGFIKQMLNNDFMLTKKMVDSGSFKFSGPEVG